MFGPMVANKQMIEQIFDGAATSYNRAGPSIFTQFGQHLVEQIPLTPGASVLDVATGTGAILLPTAKRIGSDGHITGIDLSGEMLKEAETTVHMNGLTNIDLLKMDAEHLEFPDNTFDIIICAFGIFLFPDIHTALNEMNRVLKPGGYIGVSVFSKTPPIFSPGMQILNQQFMAYQVGIQMPQPLAYAPEEVEALLSQSSFSSIKSSSEANDIVYASEEDVWAFLMTLGPRATILSMNEEMRTKFKDEYLAKLHPMLRQDGLHFSLGIIYAIAQR